MQNNIQHSKNSCNNCFPQTTPVLTMSTGPPAQDQYNFAWTSKFFSFYVPVDKNKK